MKKQIKNQKELKISFLVAAHNEEKIIASCLNNLFHLPYNNYEIIVGLDGCTDNTEKIVKEFEKKSKRFSHYNLNLRQGKPAVINTIIKKATGDIIVVNDADWIFQVKDEQSLKDFISIFNNSEIGGIVEANALEFNQKKLKNSNLGFKMVAYSSQFWLDFQKKRFAQRKGNLFYLKEPTMFLTNIFRKKLFKENASLGDDFERTKDIMDAGYKIVISEDKDTPRFVPIYDKIFLSDLFKQKLRTAKAREQVKSGQKITFTNYYFPLIWHIFKKAWQNSFYVGAITTFWIAMTAIATFISHLTFRKTSTKEGWKLRMRR